jgi:hypothetical protein
MTHISVYSRVPATLMLSWFVLSDDHPASIQSVAPNSRTFVTLNLELERRIRPKLETDASQVGPFGLTINDRIAVKRAA